MKKTKNKRLKWLWFPIVCLSFMLILCVDLRSVKAQEGYFYNNAGDNLPLNAVYPLPLRSLHNLIPQIEEGHVIDLAFPFEPPLSALEPYQVITNSRFITSPSTGAIEFVASSSISSSNRPYLFDYNSFVYNYEVAPVDDNIVTGDLVFEFSDFVIPSSNNTESLYYWGDNYHDEFAISIYSPNNIFQFKYLSFDIASRYNDTITQTRVYIETNNTFNERLEISIPYYELIDRLINDTTYEYLLLRFGSLLFNHIDNYAYLRNNDDEFYGLNYYYISNCKLVLSSNGSAVSLPAGVPVFTIRNFITEEFSDYSYDISNYFTLDNGMYIPNVPVTPVDTTNWLVKSVGAFMNAELFPGFAIGGIFAVMVAFPLVIWFLKIVLGG